MSCAGKASSQSMEGELQLPEVIIQHVQSFMEGKCAARTSLLSKSWYSAWSTRPVLDIKCSYFLYPSEFWDFTMNTVQRYIDQNISVHKFIVWVEIKEDIVSRLEQLIIHYPKLRVNELNLVNQSRPASRFPLPAQLFEQIYLTKVHLEGFSINQQLAGKVIWLHLVSLSLFDVYIENVMLRDILSQCPLIEYLNLAKYLQGMTYTNVSKLHNLKTFIVDSWFTTVYVEFRECQFLNLSHLVLTNVKIDDAFFTNFAYQFPSLENLTIGRFGFDRGHQNIQISSHSLKFLTLRINHHDTTIKMAKFDVPNISKFRLSAWKHIPTVSFTTKISKQWVSKIELISPQCDDNDNSLFLVKLRNILENLRESKISLHINGLSCKCPITMRNAGSSPVVENLMVLFDDIQNFLTAMGAILSSCCPKFLNILYKKLQFEKLVMQAYQIHLNQISAQDLLYINGLKDISLEFLEESVMEWQTVKTVSDAQEILNYGPEQLRVKLIWGRITPEYTIVNFSKITNIFLS